MCAAYAAAVVATRTRHVYDNSHGDIAVLTVERGHRNRRQEQRNCLGENRHKIYQPTMLTRTITLICLLASTSFATQTENLGIRVLPAPGAVQN